MKSQTTLVDGHRVVYKLSCAGNNRSYLEVQSAISQALAHGAIAGTLNLGYAKGWWILKRDDPSNEETDNEQTIY